MINRGEQLAKLSQEHEASLVLAKALLEVAERADEQELLATIDKLKTYNDEELELHFQHEERTVFAPIFKEHREHIPFATALLKDHGEMRRLIPNLHIGAAREQIHYFAELLRKHTLQEEQELFPLIAEQFTDEQLAAIVDFTPIH
ncbi:MAG: Unknown protein [uncultured Thiotrichaceae bacterium]|uniref:Hemerythrin-like domain-containing protein n=1 Tax=uncultured Thiotrichaceae bacterium TaxID=298394 RepID=A0A6S6U0I0_9GAMM|nr:MAG: Unknown protein [uncultured Thiotrichaceae bacterium]